jgi:predicted ATPase/class 3 adenylate cyclase
MVDFPHGTVTLVFTDIEGSTRLLTSLGSRYEAVLAEHRKLLRHAFSSHEGIEVDTQGDALFYAFSKAHNAALAAIQGQRDLSSHDFGEEVELRVRMGIHTGEPTVTAEGYVGPDVHLGARICAAAWGGQIVISSATSALLSSDLEDVTLQSLGHHALKDIDERVELFQVIDPGLMKDFPVLRTKGSHPSNLTPRLASLIGREQELAALTKLLQSSETSLVTLVGPGGTGKTSVATTLGQELLTSFADGVFFVDLSALTDAVLVIPALAQALALRETPGRTLQQSLIEHLSSKDMLVIVDNFEQVMDAAPEVSDLVTHAPSLKVVVTSREALRIKGEQVFSLAPLELPSRDQDDLTEVARSPAVALFTDRARAVKADFTLNTDNASDVAAICRRLDGLPLALELAAARVNLLSPSSLLSRLDHGLKVLTSGRRDAAQRQRTLKGTIEWSYGLLSQDEQRLFRCLGVFAGGFSLEAAEAVCDRGDLATDVLDGFASLVAKSLVRAAGDQERFSMLETIREFALEMLDASGEAEEIRLAHVEFFLTMANAAYSVPRGQEEETHYLDRLEDNHDNLRSAVSWAIGAQPDLGLGLAASLGRYWYVRGYLREGRAWLEKALANSDKGVTSDRANASRYLAVMCSVQGDREGARIAATVSRDLYESLGDEAGVARALDILAQALEDGGDLAAARATYGQALESYERAGDERGAASARGNLGMLLLLMEEASEARIVISQSLRTFESVDDKEGVATSLLNLAWVALASGSTVEARALMYKSVRLVRDLRHSDLIHSCLEGLAALAVAEGRPDRGAMLLGFSMAYAVKLGLNLFSYESHIHDQLTATVRAIVGEAAWRSLAAAGVHMSLEAAFELSVDGGS